MIVNKIANKLICKSSLIFVNTNSSTNYTQQTFSIQNGQSSTLLFLYNSKFSSSKFNKRLTQSDLLKFSNSFKSCINSQNNQLFNINQKNNHIQSKQHSNFKQQFQSQISTNYLNQTKNNFSSHEQINTLNQLKKKQSFDKDNTKNNKKRYKFQTQSLSLTQIIINSKKFMEIIACLFTEKQFHKLIVQIKVYLQQLRQYQYSDQNDNSSSKNTNKKKIHPQQKFFQSVQNLFYNIVQSSQCVKQLIQLLSKCQVKKLQNQKIQQYYGIQNQENAYSNSFKNRVNIIYGMNNFDLSQSKRFSSSCQKSKYNFRQQKNDNLGYQSSQNREKLNYLLNSKLEDAEDTQQFQETDINQWQHSKQKQFEKKNYLSAAKLFIKKAPPQLQIKQNSLDQIGRKLFQNQKIAQQNIIFQKKQKCQSELQKERHQFGINWVYTYQLPYILQKNNVETFINHVEKNYGKISEYVVFPYRNMLQVERKQISYVVPDIQTIKNKRLKNKIQTQISLQAVPSLQQQCLEIKRGRMKSSTQRILEKIRKEKQLRLNKSSMLIKFDNIASKKSVLYADTRLYGISFKNFSNIRFQQAQSKRFVAMNMIPWGCQSDQLLDVINNALKPLQITLTYSSRILTRNYLFIEFQSFYESFYAVQLLNNLKFQNQNLKAQISYGSSQSHKGQFKSNLQLDHYDNLVKKLKQIRCFYSDLL